MEVLGICFEGLLEEATPPLLRDFLSQSLSAIADVIRSRIHAEPRIIDQLTPQVHTVF